MWVELAQVAQDWYGARGKECIYTKGVAAYRPVYYLCSLPITYKCSPTELLSL